MIKKINNCEVCHSKNLFKVLDLGKHPLCDDLIKVGSKQNSKLYKIEILFCKKCFTAHQKYQVNKKILFIGNLSSSNDKYNYEILKKKNKVYAINTEVFLISSKLFYLILYHFYFNLIETWLFYRFKKRIVKNYDLIWVESGELLGKKLIENLKKKG